MSFCTAAIRAKEKLVVAANEVAAKITGLLEDIQKNMFESDEEAP